MPPNNAIACARYGARELPLVQLRLAPGARHAEPGALATHAGVYAGDGEQSPTLPRQLVFQGITK